MSYYRAENTDRERRADERDQKPVRRRSTKPASVSSWDRAVAVLTDRNASDADRLRAWLRAGVELGAVTLNAADKLGSIKR